MKRLRLSGGRWLVLAALLIMSLTMAACGGGGGGDTPAVPIPQLGINKQNLPFSATASGVVTPVSQTFTVTNVGTAGSTLAWSLASDETWVTVNPASGSLIGGQSATVTVSVSAASLAAGTHSAAITVSAQGATAKTVNVQLSIATPAPVMTLGASTLSFSPSAQAPQSFTVSNTGDAGTTVDWMIDNSAFPAWLTVAPLSGSVAAGGSSSVTASLGDISALAPGTYNATVSVAATGLNAQTVAVTLTIPAPGVPIVSVSPSTMSFSATAEGGAAPATQTFTITNTGDDNSTLDWTVGSDQSWLSFAPATSGSLAKGASETITVTADITGRLAGTHNATITVTGAGVGAQTIGVQLTIGAALAANPTALSFSVAQGQNPAAKALALTNASNLSVAWTGSDDQQWLSISPSSGSLAAGGQASNLQVSISSQALAQGTYNGTITITPTAGQVSPVTVPVTLTVTPPAQTASNKVFIGGTAGVGQLSSLLGAKAVRKAAGGQADILPDAKVTITVIKADGSKTVSTTKTNASGAYSLEVAAATGDTITVKIEKEGYTTLNKTITVNSATDTQYTVSGNVAQAQVGVVAKDESGVFKAGGGTGPGFRFGLMRKGTGERVPFASAAGVRRAAVNDQGIPDVDISIPASWAPGATALKAELAAFDPSVAAERGMFPGEFVGVGGASAAAGKANTNEYPLESVAFFQSNVTPNNGQPLTPTLATGASKAASEPTLIYKWIPQEGCGAMQKYEDRDTVAPGVQVPIYTYNPNDGKWGYLGEGTIKVWNGESYLTVPEGEIVDVNNGGKLTGLACGTENYYFEIAATEWYTWWNLDYPLVTDISNLVRVAGRVVDGNSQPVPGAYVEADGYAGTGSTYAYTYAEGDGTFTLELLLGEGEALSDYVFTVYNFSVWPQVSTPFTPVDSRPNDSQVGDVVIVDQLSCSITGYVYQDNNGSKAPFPYTWVESWDNNWTYYNWVSTDQNGFFSMKAPCNKQISVWALDQQLTVNVNNSKGAAEKSDSGTVVQINDVVRANLPPEIWSWVWPNPVKAGQVVYLEVGGWDYEGNYPFTYAWTITDNATGQAVTTSDLDWFEWQTTTAGSYTATVSVTDSLGKMAQESTTLYVEEAGANRPPEIWWTWADAGATCGGAPIFYVYAYDFDGDPLSYVWSANAGSPQETQAGWGEFVPTGTVTGDVVTVTVDDGRGGSVSADIVVPAAGGLELYYTDVWPTNPVQGSTVELYADAWGPGGAPLYEWTVTDPSGQPVTTSPYYSDNSSVTFVPEQVGAYAVSLTVTDASCGNSLTRSFTVTASGLSVAMSNQFVQYRTYEESTQNRAQGWVEYRDNGQRMSEWDFWWSGMLDPNGWVLASDPTYWQADYLTATWDATTSQFGPASPQGFAGWSFNLSGLSVPAGTYTFETELYSGAVLTSSVDYPGQTALPVVSSSTMSYQWQADGSLTLNWSEPASPFDAYRLVLYNVGGAYPGFQGEIFYGVISPGVISVTIPPSLYQSILDYAGISTLGNIGWEMQTRNIDGNGMNYARGYSKTVVISPPPGIVDVIIR